MGNFSRDTFDKLKHYVSVRMQQGRVLTDADWNEHEDIRKHELQDFLKRFVGNGVPKGNDGFHILPINGDADNDFIIRGGDGTPEGAGCCLVEGWEVLNESDTRYTEQTLFNNVSLAEKWGVPTLKPLIPPVTGKRTDMVYLDVWEREVDGEEDNSLVEPALEGPTGLRLKREWVVRIAEGTSKPPTPPSGHVFYPLATLTWNAGDMAIELNDIKDLRRIGIEMSSKEISIVDYTPPKDCRNLKDVKTVQQAINLLIRLKNLFYVSGNGQKVLPDLTKEFSELPQPFQVGVSNMCGPVSGATVLFEIFKGNGRLKNNYTPTCAPVEITTDSNGIASCYCEIDNKTPTLQVKANLMIEYEHPIHFPIIFTVNCKTALQFQIFMGKDNQFYFRLYIGGEIILRSEGYASKSGCQNGISAVKKYASKGGRYKRKTAADGQFYFVLTAPNKEVIGISKMYATEEERDKGIEMVKELAPNAIIEDIN